ncbi:MAG: hypothetical protein H7Y19_05385 [Luteimonas sp.]|nr:hypothetical protein [Luteimonas sp.]
MELLPPRLFGPLSECSRFVRFDFAIPGATVVALRTRDGQTTDVGKAIAPISNGLVPFDPSVTLAAGDLITAYQYDGSGASPWQPDAIEVQTSEGKFNAPQVLTHLYSCSRGFTVGAMRPGTRVEVLHSGSVIATGVANDGVAHVRTVGGGWLPNPGKVLTIRQRICPSPPPPGGAPEWVIDNDLPPIEPLQSPGGELGEVPAPLVIEGHTECSRAVTVGNVIPGAEVVLEGPGSGWWATSGPSDATTVVIPLAVKLKEGEKIEARQEFGCRTTSARSVAIVGAHAALGQPRLAQIDCPTTSTVGVDGLKAGADLEFEVTHQGVTRVYRGIATQLFGAFPSPPMPAGAIVRVRQGECDRWSAWSEPRTANALPQPVSKLRIVGELFQCQNAITVENIWPLAGTIVVRSSVTGEIARVVGFGNIATITVAPSLMAGHDIAVEHQVCGQRESDRKTVKLGAVPGIGDIEQPFDGDTQVTVLDVTSGAYIEIWNRTDRLAAGYAPSSTTGKTKVSFGLVKPLVVGQHIHATFWHCGHYGRNEGRPVFLRKPVLESVAPSSVSSPSGNPTTFGLQGLHFRPGAMMWFEGAGLVTTTFLSVTELRASVPGYHFDSPHTAQVQVRNPDGQVTGLLNVEIGAAPPAPPDPPPPQPSVLQAESVEIFQCNTNHRDVHVWKADLSAGAQWQFVATISHQYDSDWGTCPVDESPATTIDLTDGHDYAIAVIDPENIGCIAPGGDPAEANPPAGQPDLVNAACMRMSHLVIRGKTGAGVFKYVIN